VKGARTMTDEAGLGTVAVLRRYPVKSMLGEDLPGCEVTRQGLSGDRVLGLVHRRTGKVASARNPRLWRDLLRLHASDAALDRAVPEEVLRDGVRATVSVEVSHIGGAAPGGNFVDFAPLHLLTTSTLDRIGPQPCAGVYAQVLVPGRVSLGDIVRPA
jgi:uncharacterized protein